MGNKLIHTLKLASIVGITAVAFLAAGVVLDFFDSVEAKETLIKTLKLIAIFTGASIAVVFVGGGFKDQE